MKKGLFGVVVAMMLSIGGAARADLQADLWAKRSQDLGITAIGGSEGWQKARLDYVAPKARAMALDLTYRTLTSEGGTGWIRHEPENHSTVTATLATGQLDGQDLYFVFWLRVHTALTPAQISTALSGKWQPVKVLEALDASLGVSKLPGQGGNGIVLCPRGSKTGCTVQRFSHWSDDGTPDANAPLVTIGTLSIDKPPQIDGIEPFRFTPPDNPPGVRTE